MHACRPRLCRVNLGVYHSSILHMYLGICMVSVSIKNGNTCYHGVSRMSHRHNIEYI